VSAFVITVKVTPDFGVDVEAVEHPDPEVGYDTLSTAVGGMIERVALRTPEFPQEDAPKPFPFDLWVNEEGLLKALPLNGPATALAAACGMHEPYLVGDVILTSGVSVDGETRPLSEDDAIVLMSFFSVLERFTA
jgi:hypothetical protein